MTQFKNICCNVCGSNKSRFLFYGIDRLHGFDGQFTYVKCDECGLVYMNPQIATDDISRFYPNDYAPHKVGNKKPQKFIKQMLPIPTDVLKKINAESKVLDVGCGSGKFLFKVKKQIGCQVEGVDISTNAVKTAKDIYGLNIFQGDLLDAPFAENHFDLITAFSYIEHVPNPNEIIKKISELLKPDGAFLISTANINSWVGRLFKEKWYHLDCPRHLFLFSPETLTTMVEGNGLSVEKIFFDKTSKGWSGSLQYYFYGNNYRPKVRNKLRRSKLIKAFASPLARLACLFDKADMMTIYGYK